MSNNPNVPPQQHQGGHPPIYAPQPYQHQRPQGHAPVVMPAVNGVAAPVRTKETGQSAVDVGKAKSVIDTIFEAYGAKLVGQEELRVSLMVALVANGHILLESLPGLAKTTAAKTLADTISASFKRIQCTPDLLPSDIIGSQIFDNKSSTFSTVLGPVHANFVLLDEINRSSAKTQSAMLEAMQERQTSVAGEVHHLPKPFMVIATQNPIEQEGTYRLPEAQLDRFLIKEILRYPKPAEEEEILLRADSGILDDDNIVDDVVSIEDILWLQEEAKKVSLSAGIRKYIINIVNASRNIGALISPQWSNYVEHGASPRASLAFSRAGRAVALLRGRDHVIPEDIKYLRYGILRHRIITTFEAEAESITPERVIDEIFNRVPTP